METRDGRLETGVETGDLILSWLGRWIGRGSVFEGAAGLLQGSIVGGAIFWLQAGEKNGLNARSGTAAGVVLFLLLGDFERVPGF
jgi:hypothetical protein